MLGRVLFFSSIFFAVAVFSANAQFFEEAEKSSESAAFEPAELKTKDAKNDSLKPVAENVKSVSNTMTEKKSAKTEDISPFDYVKIDTEVKRNGSDTIYPAVMLNEKNERVYKEEILLTMRNFNVYRTPSRQVRCSARFSVLSTYNEKISNISYQLKWPNMSTRLTFDNVNPSIEYYMDYLLIGDGCYTMDKIPNVIVNRCRVKGKTQKECAASVHWVTRGI